MADYEKTFTTSMVLSVQKLAQRTRKWRKYNLAIITLNALLIIGSIVGAYLITDKNVALIFNTITALLALWLGFYMVVNVVELTNYGGEYAGEKNSRKTWKRAVESIVNPSLWILRNIIIPVAIVTLSTVVLIYLILYILPGDDGKTVESPLNIASIIIALGGLILMVYSSIRLGHDKIDSSVRILLLAVVSFIATFMLLQVTSSQIFDSAIKSITTEPGKTISSIFIHVVAWETALFMFIGAVSLGVGLIRLSYSLIEKSVSR